MTVRRCAAGPRCNGTLISRAGHGTDYGGLPTYLFPLFPLSITPLDNDRPGSATNVNLVARSCPYKP